MSVSKAISMGLAAFAAGSRAIPLGDNGELLRALAARVADQGALDVRVMRGDRPARLRAGRSDDRSRVSRRQPGMRD
jgi:hypothetical protein